MKPWREIAVPHKDVLEGSFLQSEFAADITAVRNGSATREYQDAKAFYERTFITEGMRRLLTQVSQRLAGKGGEPVIQLQTSFGGGKTHTLLAVFHLGTRKCALKDLAGIPEIVSAAGLKDVPQARVAVLDGNAHAPGQPWKYGKNTIRTLWGELAWQLGGQQGYDLVAASDETGTAPGKEVLKTLLAKHAPCLVLVDELVAYVRQFSKDEKLSGGTFDSNLSFVNQLTEAAKQVPNAIVLASLPESETEAGGGRGKAALAALESQVGGGAALKGLEKVVGRVQALWKPVATEEAFEIVRRRLFEPLKDLKTRDEVCKAFAAAYVAEGTKLPAETQESRYYDRLVKAYPIHPEIFDRLYEDWTTIEGFQRTRGVLRLMATVIHRLWKDGNADLLVMPGSLPLSDGRSRNELTNLLGAGWDPVIEKDIDGEKSEANGIESREPRFGAVNAARRVARTLFLGSAPSSVATKPGIRGLDRARVLLGCVQPGQPSSLYADALVRLLDKCHYLNASGDKALDSTRFWYDVRANLRREMEDRKGRYDDKGEVRGKLADVLERYVRPNIVDGIHVFTPHSDVPDDSLLRLVVLSPETWYVKEEPRIAAEAVLEYVKNNGTKPRHRGNRLVFLAADKGALSRMRDAARVALAWASIVDDVDDGRLNIDQLQKKQAQKELESAEAVLPRAARECFKWLLCPSQHNATDPKPVVEAFAINTGGGSMGSEIERICTENELVITTWSPIHLRTNLKELYWKADKPAASAMAFWEDSLKYLYLPRLKSREVLANAIYKGATARDFFGTALAQNGQTFEGFKFGDSNVTLDDTLLLIEPEAAKKYETTLAKAAPATGGEPGGPATATGATSQPGGLFGGPGTTAAQPDGVAATKLTSCHLSAEIPPATAKMRLSQLAEEIINVLSSDPNANVQVTLEIQGEFPKGVSEHIKRAITENANNLHLKPPDWE